MLDRHDELMSIVVLEAGATWPSWLSEYQRLAPNAVVIAQAHTETIDAFRARVIHRITEATTNSGAKVRVGVIVAVGSASEALLTFRESVARAILQVMGSSTEAELVLAGEGHDGDPVRHELFTLAGALCEQPGGTKVNVRVRFASGKSGVMRTAAPSTPDTESLASKGGGP
jgi:hypothetical protein